MDRALVHSQSKVEEYSNKLKWMHCIPFEMVPKGFIEQLNEHLYTYEEYLNQCPLLNELSNYWNIALVEGDQIKAFIWGSFDPLEKTMQVIRITIHPELFRVNGSFLKVVVRIVRLYAQGLRMKRVYWITHKWKSFLRKLPGEVQLTEGRVVEVANV